MTTVRERTYEVLRAYGVTTVFGNPGYTELPFLAGFPADFTYYLGLQEASVMGMADGFAQARRIPVLVNLHSAPGLGNAMGNLKAAYHNKTPLIVTTGQQRRDMMLSEPGFFAKDARELPRPYIKWSYEPARAEDVPAAFMRAILTATQAPTGPVYLALPFDDWDAEAGPVLVRSVTPRTAPDPDAITRAAARITAARRPALIVGAAVDRVGAWNDAVRLAERMRAEVYGAPAAARATFPQDHALFRSNLAFARAALCKQLQGHDLLIVLGAPVFDYEPCEPGPELPDGATLIQFTDDPDEAARALAGDAVVGDVALAARALLAALPEPTRTPPPAQRLPEPEQEGPMSADFVLAALEAARSADSIVVQEAPSHGSAIGRRIKVRRPGGHYNEGVSGIGFGLPCAVGVQIAEPSARVICVVGDGSLMYSVQALWTAVRNRARLIVLVLDNGGYNVLKASGDFLGIGHDIPGLDVGHIDHVRLAESFGARALRVDRREALGAALAQAFAADGPFLLSVAVDPAIRPLLS